VVITPLDICLEAVRRRIKRTQDTDARMELVKIRNQLTVLKKKQILADLDKGSEKYREITDKLNAVASAMKKTADAIKAASDAAALLAKIAALLAGAVGP
jgi:uncharacterized protein YydD (DUF2326 family)